MNEHALTATDGHTIPVNVWLPEAPVGVLVIAHGMAEYARRYDPFARWLMTRQIAVVASDHRGHGPACPPEELGFFSSAGGWEKVIGDLHKVVLYARSLAPEQPLTLLGHSMGSFIAQAYIQRHGEALDALILSATNRINRPALGVSRWLVRLIKTFKGPRHISPMINNMTFGAFNKPFQPNRTTHDWLSRDNAQVDRYIADPLCGFDCTTQLWSDFIGGMLSINPATWPRDLPIHLIAGTDDPVGEMGRGVRRHQTDIAAAGVKVASCRLFEGGRHEMINETNATEVWEHLYGCLKL